MLQYIPWHSISRLEKFAFRHPRLAVVSLMSSNIPFVYESVDPECFAGSPRLSFLQLSHNKATGLSEAKFAQLFGSANNLNKLSLGDCDIETITKKTFSQLRKLKTLYLFQNKLTYIEGGAFDSLPDLRELNLGRNQLATVQASLFSLDTQRRLHSLDLSGNPFVCSCDLMWFKQWFVSSPSLFQHSHFTYTCRNSSATVLLKDLSLVEQACLLSHNTSTIIITAIAVVLVLGSIVCTVYRHRWYIRLVLTFRTRGFARQQQRPEGNYCYDLFVSFASEDLDWVCEHLIPNLEDRLGLRLCVHERDFTPGKNILENIEDCVDSSRRILMIFSQHFAHSNWCQFELTFCLRHVFENDDALLVTCLGDVASRELSSTMMAVLDTTTYIQWEERVEERGVFWERIEFALRALLRQAQGVGAVA
ncbi:toll-like receptor 13 [Littorina saxatilis]